MPDWTTQNLWWLKPKPDSNSANVGFSQGFQATANQNLKQQQLRNQTLDVMLQYMTTKNKLEQDELLKRDMGALQEWSRSFAKDPSIPLPTFNTEHGLKNALAIKEQYWQQKATQSLVDSRSSVYQALADLKGPDRLKAEQMISDGASLADVGAFATDAFRRQQASATQRNAEAVTTLESEASALEASGDIQGATAKRQQAALIKATMLGAQERVEVSMDAQGKPIVNITKGGGAAGELTTATQGQVQQRLIASNKVASLAADVFQNLTGKDVGIAGYAQQLLVNEGLAQFFPELYKGGVTSARTMLRMFNERVIETISAEKGRFSDKDRARIEAMMPKLGPGESLQSAQDKLISFMTELRSWAKQDASASGVPVPPWAWSADEIKAKVGKEITKEEAIDLLLKYHPEIK